MDHVSKKFSLRKRRGISNIIGSLIVLAIVASVGSVILFQGLNQINLFSYVLTLYDKEKVSELREDIIFQHVRFDPDTTGLELYLANTGTTDSEIVSVTVVKIDTQELVINRVVPAPSEGFIPIEDDTKIVVNATLPLGSKHIWNSTEYDDSPYKVTIGTAKGNFFEQIAEPFNT